MFRSDPWCSKETLCGEGAWAEVRLRPGMLLSTVRALQPHRHGFNMETNIKLLAHCYAPWLCISLSTAKNNDWVVTHKMPKPMFLMPMNTEA